MQKGYEKTITLLILCLQISVIHGQNIADRFDYPIGDKGIDVNGNAYEIPEVQTFFEFGSSGWYNAQDVGDYYDEKKGYHPGEDWNKSLRINDKNDKLVNQSIDGGENVYAIANGKVLRTESTGVGSFILIEHTLIDNSKVDSLYLLMC